MSTGRLGSENYNMNVLTDTVMVPSQIDHGYASTRRVEKDKKLLKSSGGIGEQGRKCYLLT